MRVYEPLTPTPLPLHSLMFGWEYPPLHSGGLGVACQGLVRGLLKNGVQVTLVLPVGAEEEAVDVRTTNDDGVAVRHIRSALRPYEGGSEYALRLAALGIPAAVDELYGPDMESAVERYAAESVAITSDLHPDVVHGHDWMTFEAARRASAYHGCPFVAHVHATEFDRTDFHPNPWIADMERRGLESATRVVAVSRYTAGILSEHYGIPPGNITVVHNAHEITARGPAPIVSGARLGDPPTVLFLGRLTVQKNPWQFLEVARRVHELAPSVRFVMAGDGPMLGGLIDRACTLGLSDSVIFTGKVSRSEVDALFRSASCFVMPSLSEPFGLVALEAIGHGVPVILSRQSGASEVIDHAFKVDFWDRELMADCILTILREEPLASQLRSEAPRLLQRLTWQHQASLIRSLYEQMISALH